MGVGLGSVADTPGHQVLREPSSMIYYCLRTGLCVSVAQQGTIHATFVSVSVSLAHYALGRPSPALGVTSAQEDARESNFLDKPGHYTQNAKDDQPSQYEQGWESDRHSGRYQQ